MILRSGRYTQMLCIKSDTILVRRTISSIECVLQRPLGSLIFFPKRVRDFV